MFIFGHMGIGSKLVGPWSKGLSKKLVLLGTLVPDLIDKPLYYGMSWFTGRRGAEIGLISGTRTFGHTAFLLLATGIFALIGKSRALAALTLGYASHLVLDQFGEHTETPALLWPFTGLRFPTYPYEGLTDHLSFFGSGPLFWTEVAGLVLLGWDYWKLANKKQIFKRRIRLRR